MRVELIGPTRVATPDGRTIALDRANAALLALLALDGSVERRRLIALLWPDKDPKNGHNNLRQRLFKLRREVGGDLVQGADLLTLAAAVRTDTDLAATGVALKSGELLHDHRYDDLEDLDQWVTVARARWRTARRRALVQSADTCEREHRLADALACAIALLDDEATDESWRRVVRLHYLDGNRAAAREVLERWRARADVARRPAASPEMEQLARLIESGATVGAPAAKEVPVALLRTPSLVGRAAEWQAIERGLARGHVVLLKGDPGIGKSRLARDVAAARGDMLVVGARPGDAAQPFALLARLLRALAARFGAPAADAAATREVARVVPEFAAQPPAGEATRLVEAVHAVLAAWIERGWSAVVIDDLQFADAASLETLLGWIDEPAARRLARLFTVRAAEVPALLSTWVAARAGEGCVEIALRPLDEAGVAALIDSLDVPHLDAGRWAPRVVRHTGGNPLFVIETLLACHEAGGFAAFDAATPLPAPANVGHAIDQRLARLSPAALRVARVAALAGADCGPAVIAAIIGCPVVDLADPWRELEAREVVRDGAFAHDLVLEAVTRSVPAEIARAVHADVARELEARDYPAARIAPHWRAARAWPQAARQYLRAADTAAAQSRRDDEAALLSHAAACCDQAGDRAGAFAARVRRVDTLVMAGSLATVGAELAALEPLAADDHERLSIRLLQSRAGTANAEGAAAERAAREAIALAERIGDHERRLIACLLLGTGLAARGDAAAALAVLEPLVAARVAFAGAREQIEFEGTLGFVHGSVGRRRAAAGHLETAARLALEMGDALEAITLLSNLAVTLALLGRPADAAARAEQAHALSVHAGAKAGVAVGSNETVLALAAVTLGRFAYAETVLEAAIERFRSEGAAIWTFTAEGILANLYVLLGQVARARRALAAPPDGIPAARIARRLIIDARIERAGGGSGVAKLRAAVAMLDGAQRTIDRVGALLALAPACPPAEALALARDAQAHCAPQELDAHLATARVWEADALRRSGAVHDAAALARDLMQAMASCWPHDVYHAEVWWVLHQVFDAAGAQGEARHALASGIAWLRGVLPQVPDAYRDGFLHRQPINRALLTTASRRLGADAALIEVPSSRGDTG